jgi:hypothetical protein
VIEDKLKQKVNEQANIEQKQARKITKAGEQEG